MNTNPNATIKSAMRHTVLSLLSVAAMAAFLLFTPSAVQAQADGLIPLTITGSSSSTVDETGEDYYEVRNQFATMTADAPVGTTVIYRYNLAPQGPVAGGQFGRENTNPDSLDMLVRYRDNGPGFRVIIRIMEARLTAQGIILHNLFNSDLPLTTFELGPGGFVDGDNVPFSPNPLNPSNQTVYDFDVVDGVYPAGDSDGAPGDQVIRFGGSSYYLEVELTKLDATGEGGFIGAAIIQR